MSSKRLNVASLLSVSINFFCKSNKLKAQICALCSFFFIFANKYLNLKFTLGNIILLAGIVITVNIARAQEPQTVQTNSYYFEPAVHYGFLAAHKSNMHYLVKGHFPSLEINLGIQTNGKKGWQSLYGYPDYGIMYWHSGFNNNVLGKVHGFIPYMNFPLFNLGNNIKESFKLGAGVGYLTKKHERLVNYKNFVIGSDLNAAISMHFVTNFQLHKKFYLNTSFGLTHFSNGSFRQPNIGLNIPTLKFGARYNFGKSKTIITKPLSESDNKLEYSALSGFGIKEIWGGPIKKKYNVYFIETNVSKPLSQKSSIAAGIDLFYDESDFFILDKDTINYNSKTEIIKPGIHLAHDLKISNLSIVFLTGRYLYEKEKKDGSLYTKLGIRYSIQKHFMMELSLKAHLATAEYIGYGIGYKF